MSEIPGYGKQLALSHIDRLASELRSALEYGRGLYGLKVNRMLFNKKVYGHDVQWEYLIELEHDPKEDT